MYFFSKITALFNTINVKQEFYYMPNGLANLQNTQQNYTKFSAMLEDDDKRIRENNCKQILNSNRANWKKAPPRIWWNRL